MDKCPNTFGRCPHDETHAPPCARKTLGGQQRSTRFDWPPVTATRGAGQLGAAAIEFGERSTTWQGLIAKTTRSAARPSDWKVVKVSLASMGSTVDERIDAVESKIVSEKPMGAAALAKSQAERLVVRVETRTRSRMLAYEYVARGVGRSVTWVRTLTSAGVTRVDADVGRKIDALLARELQNEIARLTHDIHLARQSGAHPASDEVLQAEGLLQKATALLNGSAR